MSAGLFGPLRDWASNSDTVRRWRTQRYELFERLCNLRPDDRILDVGAGWGAALERFNTVNPIVALDLNPTESDWLAAPNVTDLDLPGKRVFIRVDFNVPIKNGALFAIVRW